MMADRKPKIKLPEGYDSEHDFLAEMREEFSLDVGADSLNRTAAMEDLAFAAGDQWDQRMRAKRERALKPVLTINRIPAFIAQVLGMRRLNETTIKFEPDNGGTQQVAQLREDLVRNIQKISKAELAYNNALAGAVICGVGNFRVDLEYEDSDVFEQTIMIRPIMDHLAVVWDRACTDPTGQDARHAFVIDMIDKKDFDRLYPWAQPSDLMTDSTMSNQLWGQGWYAQGMVRVVEYWVMRTEKRVLAMMQDGSTVDVTDVGDPTVLANIALKPDGSPFMREVNRPYAQKYVCSGTDILAGPYNLPIKRIPVFRAIGWETRIGAQVYRNGIVRFLKDPQRLHNYYRSVLAERLMQTPRAVWTATADAVAGRENAWRNSHLSDDALLIWNADAGQEPRRVEPAQMEPAFLTQANLTTQDIKDVSNIHEANLGMPSNEVSGVAIKARQAVSDSATAIYMDNVTDAIEEAGKVINDLIPIAYDTPRIIKTVGDDAKTNAVLINAMGNQNSIDITLGKYAVTVTTGPSYATKLDEQAENMAQMYTAMPQVFADAADLVVEAQNWPGAKQIAERLRARLPPGLLDPSQMSPQVAAAQQQQAQQQQQQQQLQEAMAQSKLGVAQSQAALNMARAQHYEAQTQLAPADMKIKAASAASEVVARQMRDHIEVLKMGAGNG
jgi:hypothetical protein